MLNSLLHPSMEWMVGTILVALVAGIFVIERGFRDVERELRKANKYLFYLSWMEHRSRAGETGESWSDPGV